MKPSERIAGLIQRKASRRVRTPTVLQMEAAECGAAALAIVLAYYGRSVPLEELRIACGVSRDGSRANNVVRAARSYGLTATGYRMEPADLPGVRLPFIVYWNFNHFLVVEGFGDRKVFLNDPALGPRVVSADEFDRSFTGVVLACEPGPDFKQGGARPSVLRALRNRLRGSEPALLYVVLASLALLLIGLVVPAFSRIFIDDYLVGNLGGWIPPLLTGMTLTALLIAAFTWLQQHYLLRLETRLALGMSGKFFWHVLHLPIEFFAQRYAGEIGTRVAINDSVAQLLSGVLATNLLNLVLIVFYVLVLLRIDAPLTALGIAIALLNIAALRAVSRRRRDSHQKLLQERGKLAATGTYGLQTIETLKATGAESDFFARWSGYQAKVLNAEQELAVSSILLSAAPPWLSAVNAAVILTAGGMRVMNGELSIGTLIAFQVLMFAFMHPVNQLVQLSAQLQEVQGNLNRLEDVLHNPALPNPAPERAGAPMGKLAGSVELRGLTFGYQRLEEPLIAGFDLVLKPGSRVALVGNTGSGKSTISRLVAGLYEPWSGEILFDGSARRQIPRGVLNGSLAMVDQDIFLLEGTIQENLSMWDAGVPEASIVQAAKDACIHEEISNRPGGYDYPVEEGGRNFSGGQRQRLEVARALVNNPSILVLDEATSALDPITEKAIDDNLRRRGCTCLIIAHRLSTIRDCDEIIVLERGRVVQRGTHDEMRDADGPYARLIRAETADAPPAAAQPRAPGTA